MKNSTKAFIVYLVNVNCANILLQLVMHVHMMITNFNSQNLGPKKLLTYIHEI